MGDKTKKIELIVDQEKIDWAGWFKLISNFISEVSWPLLAFVVFAVLASWEGLRKLILSINQAEVGGFKIATSDLSSRMTAALEDTINSIERNLPQTIATRFLPSSLGSDVAYHVHILEFLHKIGHPGTVSTWNAAGNYYFEDNQSKAATAYDRAIALDRNDPDAYANLGMLHLMQIKDNHTAKQLFTKALELADNIDARRATCR